jgi:predicted phosphodiesterase
MSIVDWFNTHRPKYRERALAVSECARATGHAKSTCRKVFHRLEKTSGSIPRQENYDASSVTQKIKDQQDEINRLTTTIDRFSVSKRKPVEIPSESNTISFGLIGDTHLGSLYERMDDLHSFYEICKNQGIKIVLHCGDLLDGHKMYKGHEYELRYFGWDAQIKHLQADYPKVDGLKTYFIAGNHDQSFSKQIGMDVGVAVQQVREDMVFLGNDSATVNFKTPSGRPFSAKIYHPGGGTSYAVSYRSQKIVESLAGGAKPNLLGIGHLHKADNLPHIRNIAAFQVGCFQAQTPFMESKPSDAHVGGWIIDYNVGKQESMCDIIRSSFVKFY